MAIYWPTPDFKGRTFKLCVLTRWDFHLCVRSSPLRGEIKGTLCRDVRVIKGSGQNIPLPVSPPARISALSSFFFFSSWIIQFNFCQSFSNITRRVSWQWIRVLCLMWQSQWILLRSDMSFLIDSVLTVKKQSVVKGTPTTLCVSTLCQTSKFTTFDWF